MCSPPASPCRFRISVVPAGTPRSSGLVFRAPLPGHLLHVVHLATVFGSNRIGIGLDWIGFTWLPRTWACQKALVCIDLGANRKCMLLSPMLRLYVLRPQAVRAMFITRLKSCAIVLMRAIVF